MVPAMVARRGSLDRQAIERVSRAVLGRGTVAETLRDADATTAVAQPPRERLGLA